MTRPTILVTGATGKTGSAVAHELLKQDWPVRALVHKPDARSDALAAKGADIAVADMFDGEQMAAAMVGVQRAYFVAPINPKTGQTLDAFMYAAEKAGLEAVAAMTQWLASASHPAQTTRDMWAIEQQLPTLKNTAVTILNPGFFADNYLRVGIGMAAQLGLYANFVGDSKNAPPSNADMGRVAAAVLTDPRRHAGRRYRITGPELIGVREIVATLSTVLNRKVRAIDAPEWLLNKVAAYRGENRFEIAVFSHYLEDHRQGAFAFGAPTTDVFEVTGQPPESFETTVRAYLSRPEAQRNAAAFVKAFKEFMLSPIWPGYDNARFEREAGLTPIANPLYAMEDDAWKADRGTQTGMAA
jgi:uncharacterized protein YbjT (DUF2867 family)